MFRRSDEGKAVLFALLLIWVCVIIFKTDCLSGDTTQVSSFRYRAPEIIVDPGHGGYDGGAVSLYGTKESDINWDIARRLRDLLSFCGVEACLSRQTREIHYPDNIVGIAALKKWDTRRRVEFISGFEDAVLISIHQNYYPSPQPSGAQVLYARNEESETLGRELQQCINKYLQPEDQRRESPASKDVYLLNHIRCPAVLLECGFLSNPTNAKALETPGMQKKLAVAAASVLYHFTEMNAFES